MEKLFKCLSCLLLCGILLMVLVPVLLPAETQAKNYGTYADVVKVYDQGSCPSMQGMSLHGNYVYACKINGDTETAATVARIHKTSGATDYLTDSSTGSMYFTDFGHGNDIEVETVAGLTTLFVPTSKTGSGSLVRYVIEGTTATKVASYTMTYNGSNVGGGAIRVMHQDSEYITFLFKSGSTCYTGKVGVYQTSGTMELSYLCKLDYSTVYVNDVAKDTSDYSLQGMGYHDFKLYLPLSGHTTTDEKNVSVIAVYDLEGASGTIKPEPDISFCITSSYYGALFELESCEIDPATGRLYFNTNRRKADNDTNHDGVSYISNWTYAPQSRYSEVNNYRWEVIDGVLTSVTDGGAVYNGLDMSRGSVSGNTLSDNRYTLSKTVVLEHDREWILEWKSKKFTTGSMLFATQAVSSYANQPYIFCRVDNALISIGENDGSRYNNYGIAVADYGIDVNTTHTYRMTNKIAADGSNMVYLSVDGKELGALNNHYIAGTSQGTTSNWISGKDLQFSYMGTDKHSIGIQDLEYIQIWGDGMNAMYDEPNTYRWEDNGSGLAAVTDWGLTANALTLTNGSYSGGVYTSAQLKLANEITLLHNRPWSMEWETKGTGTMLFAADDRSKTYGAPYIYRSGTILGIGAHDGTNYSHYGLKFADYGVDNSASHVYRLTNKIAADGSNMLYLSVDGVELGAMNQHYYASSYQNETSDWVSGKDFTFGYFGTYQHSLNSSVSYIQVWENGIPAEDTADNFRWETQNNAWVSVTDGGQTANTPNVLAGSCTDGVYSDSRFILDKPVTLRHDSLWSVEWQAEGTWSGGSMMLSSTLQSNTKNNVYLFRSGVIAIGTFDGSQYNNYGVLLSDYGIDRTAAHVYRLENRINADGSNMVYLLVDGVEIAPLNQNHVNGGASTGTSNWISGKDFQFPYTGTVRHPIQNGTMAYMTVSENCTHSFGDWVTVAPGCTTPGSRTRECVHCGYREQESIPAAHNWSNGVCTGCGISCTHTFVDDVCSICGESAVMPTIIPKYPSLSFEGEIFYNVYFATEGMENVDLADMGLLTWNTPMESGTIDNAQQIIPGAQLQTNGYCVVRSNGIPAKYLGDTLYFKIYAKLPNGEYVYSGLYNYSAKAYAKDRLANSTNANMKALCLAMMNYGTAAQTHFNYKPYALMNEDFATYQSLIKTYDASMVAAVGSVSPSKSVKFPYSGFSSRYPSVTFEGAFAISYYFTPSNAPDNGMKLYYWDANTYASVTSLTTANATGVVDMTQNGSTYQGTVTGIAAKEIDKTIYVAGVYSSGGTTYTTGVLPYSLGAYCTDRIANGSTTMQAFAAATAVYGYYAKTYFGT